MFFSFRKSFIALPLIGLLFICSQTLFAQSKEWREVTAAERQMTTSKVEPNADAEAIFWEVRIDDSTESLTMRHYIRVKIFTERGREKYSKVDIPFIKGTKVKDIMARVIKADGTIAELAKTDVFEREIAKADKIKIKAKSFAVPNVETGVIVEYRYTEVYPNSSANNMRMTFQHDIPIQNITYYFKPFLDGKYLTFNMGDNVFVKDKNGFYRATMENVTAIKEEPQMPPEDEVRSWLLMYYQDKDVTTSDFWSYAGYDIAKKFDIKDTLKPSKEVKAAAEQIASGVQTPDEKLAKIFDFCKMQIKNITYDPQMTDEQKEAIKENKSTGETYQKKQGTATEINQLFASMVTALGFEARLAFGGDRSKKFFNPQQAHVSFIHFTSIAVKVGGEWKYYDPGSFFLPYGMLAWFEEDTSVLLLNSKDYLRNVRTPISGIGQSVAKRNGKFKLLEDGTLEGTVKIEYSGHLSYLQKMDNYEKSPAKREEMLKEDIKARMSTAEVSDISIENVSDAEKPFTYQYKIRVPNYASKTGKRLFLQPGFFEYGTTPVFSSATRKYPIYFQYPWSEQDNIEIEIPKGFELDNAETPAPLNDPSNIGSLSFKITIDKATNIINYQRKFHFANGPYLFPVSSYPAIKGLFDAFNKADLSPITLKQN